MGRCDMCMREWGKLEALRGRVNVTSWPSRIGWSLEDLLVEMVGRDGRHETPEEEEKAWNLRREDDHLQPCPSSWTMYSRLPHLSPS